MKIWKYEYETGAEYREWQWAGVLLCCWASWTVTCGDARWKGASRAASWESWVPGVESMFIVLGGGALRACEGQWGGQCGRWGQWGERGRVRLEGFLGSESHRALNIVLWEGKLLGDSEKKIDRICFMFWKAHSGSRDARLQAVGPLRRWQQ